MSELQTIKVMLVEDDEDDFILTRGLFNEMKEWRVQLEWFKSYQLGLPAMLRNQHDVCLVDYRLGAKNGVELLQEAVEKGCQLPIILLTGLGEHAVDLQAMKAGAADYLVKSTLRSDALERSIRYALERKRLAAAAAFEQASLAAFGADIGLALTQRESLAAILYQCADLVVRYLNVHLAQIWILHPSDKMLHLKASAGAINDNGSESNPLTQLNPDKELIGDGKPVLLNNLTGNARVPYREWVAREGIVAYAGYPLMLENRLIGLLSVYSHNMLSPAVIQEMGSVANGIALTIERKRSEEALNASEGKYRSVVESLREVVFQLNEFGHWTSLNPAWKEITGFEVKETLGTLFLEYIHADDRQRNSHVFLQLIERKLDYCRHETQLLTKDGKVRWVEIYAQLTLNSDGGVLGASGSITDITERKHAEREIQKLAAFPRVNPNPVLEFDAEGGITYFNDAAQELARSLGYAHPQDILPPNSAEIAKGALASSEKKLNLETAFGDKKISWSFFPVAASRVVHCYGADITEMENLEAQFRQAQKMESVGQLAAGVAHDFNNILTVIQGHTDNLLTRNGENAPLAVPLKQILDASRRAATLTRQLLMFSRKQALQPRPVDLNAVLGNSLNMLGRVLGEDVALVTNFEAGLPLLLADVGMLEQVFMNLAVNSRAAMPKGGQLGITTATVTIDAAYVKQHPGSREGKAICLSVADTGHGMDRATMSRIFEPFFTTKAAGQGTGLGLATVHGIVKQHQGWIEVKSEVGAGTTFDIFLPVPANVPQQVSEAAPPVTTTSKGQRETILLVEDEEILRELVKEILEQADYRVVEAANGVEALKVWEEHNGEFDLLLTDMLMPEGMTGGDLAKQLRVRQPELKVIYTSGYSAEIMGENSDLRDSPFLAKPYSGAQLTRLVRDCLDQKPAVSCAHT
jgi:two-component system cell cycle sensor histidine kinase/response regulator CckA